MRKNSRLLAIIMAVAILIMMMAGCSSASSQESTAAETPAAEPSATESTAAETPAAEEETEKEPEPVTITIGNWPAPDASNYEDCENRREAFMEAYPYITVETDNYGYSTDTFLAKAASGQLPDLFYTFYTEVDKIINAGYAEDITDAFNATEYASCTNPDVLSLVEKDGRIYGIPVSSYSIGLYCNVELFTEAGLVDADGIPLFPTTWEELAETAATIKEKTGKAGFSMPTTDGQGGWLFASIAWSFGAEFETLEDGKWKATFDSAEGVAALEYIKDLKWEYNAFPDSIGNLTDWMNLYGSDQVAMGMCHPNLANGIVSSTGMSKDNMAMTALPEGPAGRATLTGGGIYMMAKGTTPEQQDAILKWLLFGDSSPRTDETSLANYEATCKTNAESGYPVGPTGVRLWVNCNRVEEEQKIRDRYCNVDMRLWNTYCEKAEEGLHAEPPVNAQELYAALDSVLQEVLTNKDADCQKLLTDAATNFQRDYLDKAN